MTRVNNTSVHNIFYDTIILVKHIRVGPGLGGTAVDNFVRSRLDRESNFLSSD